MKYINVNIILLEETSQLTQPPRFKPCGNFGRFCLPSMKVGKLQN